MRRLLLALPLLSVLGIAPVHATPTQTSFAADGYSSTWDCRYRADMSRCNPVNPTLNGSTTHWPGGASSSAASARGEAWSLAVADPGAYLPILKTYASSNPNYVPAAPNGDTSMADANIWGVQGYRYTGATPFELTVSVTLDSQFSPAVSGAGYNHSFFAVSLFDTEGYTFDYNLNAQSGSSCPILRTASGPGCANLPEIFARDQRFLYDTGSVTTTVSYMLHPGQTFYVGAYLDANVCCGGVVDSSHTLTMRFNDAAMLDSFAVAMVPEPGQWALMLTGLVLLSGFARRPCIVSRRRG